MLDNTIKNKKDNKVYIVKNMDEGVAEGYGFSLYQDYYDLDSKLVKEQVEIHSPRLEQ